MPKISLMQYGRVTDRDTHRPIADIRSARVINLHETIVYTVTSRETTAGDAARCDSDNAERQASVTSLSPTSAAASSSWAQQHQQQL